jgi:predicted O-methyltransferase YrrM
MQFKDQLDALRKRPIAHLLLWRLGITKAETQTTEAERACMARYAAGKKMLAEIGVFHGVTTCRLRRAMDPGGVLVAIDPYPNQRLGFSAQQIIARRELSKIKSGTVKWMRTTGTNAARELCAIDSPRFGFVFVDGDHSWEGLQGDWEGWKRLLAPGGIIAIHDSRSTPSRQIDDAGSVRFTREVIARDPDFETVDTVDSLTVLRRRTEAVV